MFKLLIDTMPLMELHESLQSVLEDSKAFESHWEELFVPDPVVNGRKISFRRHNNGLESSHRIYGMRLIKKKLLTM
jgi:hypothetical protein